MIVVHERMRDMLPVLNGVHGGDWIACEIVSPGYPGMGGSCIASIAVLCYCLGDRTVGPYWGTDNCSNATRLLTLGVVICNWGYR